MGVDEGVQELMPARSNISAAYSPRRCARDGDAEEVVEIPHVSHGELGVECLDETLQENHGRSREDDVVDVEEQVSRAQRAMKHEERRVGLGA
jgi:hypothetical protein